MLRLRELNIADLQKEEEMLGSQTPEFKEEEEILEVTLLMKIS